jgi:hypothetical protein
MRSNGFGSGPTLYSGNEHAPATPHAASTENADRTVPSDNTTDLSKG